MVSDEFKIPLVDGKEVTIIMYSGITNKLIPFMLSEEESAKIVIDPKMQDKFLEIMLSKYDEQGNATGYIVHPFMLSNKMREDLLVWGVEHVTDFLLGMTEKLGKMSGKVKNSEAIKAS